MTPGGNQPRRLVDRVQVRPKGIFRRPRRDTLFILLGLELGMSLKVVYCVSSSKRGSQLQTHVPKVLLVAGTLDGMHSYTKVALNEARNAQTPRGS